MGLDVGAYQGIAKVECAVEDGGCWPEHIQLCRNSDFPGQADDLQNGCYTYASALPRDRTLHRSYRGYNAFREWLSTTMLGVTPQVVWDDPGLFASKPFVELINFSDSEGCIGPRTSAKLARDFEQHREKVPQSADHWHIEAYDQLAECFAFAASDGVVDFR